jgi:hypothetical protein
LKIIYWIENKGLNTGVTLANFHSDGKEDNDSDMLNNLHSGYFNIGATSRKSRGLIQSGNQMLNRKQ